MESNRQLSLRALLALAGSLGLMGRRGCRSQGQICQIRIAMHLQANLEPFLLFKL
jgi:hypothetical protein